MVVIAVFVALALLAAAGVWWSRRAPAGHPSARIAARAPERFSAVEIRPRSGACAAAHALEGKRFLANQCPTLPLAGCTKKRCDCSFAKRSDRRVDDRRWGPGGLGAALFSKAERRKRAGRRDAD